MIIPKMDLPVAEIRSNRFAAEQLEQMFLEEMLKYCGPKPLSGAFSGGPGEEQFASFLSQARAELLAETLDLGFDRSSHEPLPGGLA